MRAHPVHSHDRAMGEPANGTGYEIRIRGVPGERLLEAFPGLDASEDRGETVLSGMLPDQAALHGILAQIGALNLELVEVRRP